VSDFDTLVVMRLRHATGTTFGFCKYQSITGFAKYKGGVLSSHISGEICQIIVITITNNNFRLRYVSSKLDQVLLLLLLTNKL
jgi:hypothetical protein